jgi:hypothetical protein
MAPVCASNQSPYCVYFCLSRFVNIQPLPLSSLITSSIYICNTSPDTLSSKPNVACLPSTSLIVVLIHPTFVGRKNLLNLIVHMRKIIHFLTAKDEYLAFYKMFVSGSVVSDCLCALPSATFVIASRGYSQMVYIIECLRV